MDLQTPTMTVSVGQLRREWLDIKGHVIRGGTVRVTYHGRPLLDMVPLQNGDGDGKGGAS